MSLFSDDAPLCQGDRCHDFFRGAGSGFQKKETGLRAQMNLLLKQTIAGHRKLLRWFAGVAISTRLGLLCPVLFVHAASLGFREKPKPPSCHCEL